MARFFGPDMPLDEFAGRSGAVGYSVLTGLGPRYARTILPVTDRIALQLVGVYNSLNLDTRVTAGLRFTW